MRDRKYLFGMGLWITPLAAALTIGACDQANSQATVSPAGQVVGGVESVELSVELKDADGVARRPLDVKGAAGAVVLFIANDCPISNGYAPEINRICAEYGTEDGRDGPGKFRFYLVHVDQDFKPEDARKHAKEYSFTCPILMDDHRALCKKLGATVTPEAFVIGEGGAVLYKGRIDDKWAGYMKSRAEPTSRDLRAALDAVRAGKAVPTAATDAVGCPIG